MAYERSDLTLNIGASDYGEAARARGTCNPGGSTICWTPTRGCGGGGPMTCVTTSTSPKAIEMQVDLPPEELEQLQQELAEVVQRAAARQRKD